MFFQIGWLTLGPINEDDPNPGPQNADWHLAHIIEVKQIPGRGKKFKTVRTSDKASPTTGPLWECTLTVRSITDTRYKQLRMICEDGGPFMTRSNHGMLPMYINDVNINHGISDKEPPSRTDDDADVQNIATWVLKLLETKD